MENENLFINGDGTQLPPYELNYYYSTEQHQIRSCFLNPNWDNNSMDQNDPFESALSSMVSSPATSNAGVPTRVAGTENIALRELIGKLGSICNSSGEISPPQSYICDNNNTSCYSTPMNSPPKLNLCTSTADHHQNQIRGNLQFLSNNYPSLAPFPADPGFAERAARFSCLANKRLSTTLNDQFGFRDSELPHRLIPKIDSGKLSRVSSNQSLKNSSGSQMMEEIQDTCCDKKFTKLSRPSTPENTELGFDSRENSSVSEQITVTEIVTNNQNDGNSRKRKTVPTKGKAKDNCSLNSAKDANVVSDNNNGRNSVKRSKSGSENNVNQKDSTKGKTEQNCGEEGGDAKPPEPPKDYIHVRARRGQATDAHSLAERVRREKISERMKLLQDLVPGCNKVTGKAVMLDEIINYVQSLQRQVEFLSMKLAVINPRMEFNVETLLSKDNIQSREAAATAAGGGGGGGFPYNFPSQVGGGGVGSIVNGTQFPFSINHMNANGNGMERNPHIQLPPLHNFGESASASQVSAFWEDDLQTVVQMGFGQNQNQSENFHEAAEIIPTSEMKIEL